MEAIEQHDPAHSRAVPSTGKGNSGTIMMKTDLFVHPRLANRSRQAAGEASAAESDTAAAAAGVKICLPRTKWTASFDFHLVHT
jgi:hypothetical protein